MVSISDLITEIYLHEIVIYFSIKLFLFCSLFKPKEDPKTCFFNKGSGFLRGEGQQNTLISNATQRKPRQA